MGTAGVAELKKKPPFPSVAGLLNSLTVSQNAASRAQGLDVGQGRDRPDQDGDAEDVMKASFATVAVLGSLAGVASGDTRAWGPRRTTPGQRDERDRGGREALAKTATWAEVMPRLVAAQPDLAKGLELRREDVRSRVKSGIASVVVVDGAAYVSVPGCAKPKDDVKGVGFVGDVAVVAWSPKTTVAGWTGGTGAFKKSALGKTLRAREPEPVAFVATVDSAALEEAATVDMSLTAIVGW